MNQSNKGFHEIIEIVARRKWMIIVPLILGTGIGALIAYGLPSYYRSATLIIVEQQKVPESYVKATDETPIERRLSTISQQIMSRTKLEQIITDFNLYNDKPKDVYSKTMRWFGLETQQKSSKEELVERMRKDIEIKVTGEGSASKKGGDAFSISFSGRDPYVAMQVTNTLASLFIEENLKVREQYAEGTFEFLSDELEKARQELESQEKSLKGFKERYMGKLPQQMEANLRTLDRLQMELQSSHAALKNAEDRKTILEEQLAALPETVPSIQRAPASPQEVELVRLKGELTALLSTYKENYPDVIITKNRIKEVEKQVDEVREKEVTLQEPSVRRNQRTDLVVTIAGLNSQITALKKQDTNIREQIRVYQKRVEDTPASEQVMSDIERDYQTSQKNYQALLEKKLSAKLAENMEKRQKGERFKVIDPANVPEKPYSPDRNKVTLGGSAVGLGIGAALVYLLEFLNPAFRRPEDFSMLLDTPVLAVIPVFSPEPKEDRSKRLRLINGGRVNSDRNKSV